MKPMKISHAALDRIDDIIADDEWVLEQKHDGAHAIVIATARRNGKGITVYDFEWLSSSGGPLKFAAAKQHFTNLELSLDRLLGLHVVYRAVLHGELIVDTGEYRIFDVTELDVFEGRWNVVPQMGYTNRRYALAHLTIDREYPKLSLVRGAVTSVDKRKLWEDAQAAGIEGVVAKRMDAPYVEGVRTTDQLKFKLVKSADVVVHELRESPKSAVLGVYDDSIQSPPGVLEPTPVRIIGSCSMIGKPVVKPGDVIEVEYLYWTGQAMIQPRMVRKRRAEEKLAADCTVEQFPAYSRAAL